MLVRDIRQRSELCRRVHRPELSGVTHRDHGWLRVMLEPEACEIWQHQLGSELAIGSAHRHELHTGDMLRSSTLIGIDVRRLRADHRAPRGAQCRERGDVSAGPIEDETHVDLVAQMTFHDCHGALGEHIVTICGHMPPIGCGDRLEHLRMHS